MKKSYLVLMVIGLLLALGVMFILRACNTEVLESFNTLNERMIENNTTRSIEIDSLQEKVISYSIYAERIKKLDSASQELTSYIEDLKNGATRGFNDDFSKMDTSNYFDTLFFNGSTLSEEGLLFVENIKKYKQSTKELKKISPQTYQFVLKTFDTRPVKNASGMDVEWLEYHFKGFPLIASITKLTQIQSDISFIKQEFLLAALGSDS
ncbi:hypothetical protein [Patiriisocius hiemis]|uniref:Gliding motility-associated protein GldM N-terminal domain-containing protein n=1 Tax=Patiriisocius hiemis TaxID=3075604 RepID=A0ABU2YFX6_9FLAO|nr:hypothetical protein [Constantimarinum sp. W242]MDT0556135.1 hypothetical protein [Constantimarinum sp. W242]